MAFVPLSGQAVFDAQGNLIEDALLYVYDTGTTSKRNVFATSALDPTKALPNPIQISGGTLPVMFTGAGDYDLFFYDKTNALIRTVIGLPGDVVAASGATSSGLATGDYVASHQTGNRSGFVRANGGSIGSSASNGSERANDDCHALFVFLWTQDQSADQLTVSGGRSPAGAEADWQANKTISLPDLQNRVPLGVGDQGHAGSQASITGALAPAGTVLGALGGEAAHTLTEAEIGGTATGGPTGTTTNVVGGTVTPHNTLPPFSAVSWYLKL